MIEKSTEELPRTLFRTRTVMMGSLDVDDLSSGTNGRVMAAGGPLNVCVCVMHSWWA